MRKKWKQVFPDSSNDEIRKFLLLFVGAFAFKQIHKLRVGLHDKVLEIYKSTTSNMGVNVLELETLSENIEWAYELDFNHVWRGDLTLGEMYREAESAQQDAAPSRGLCATHSRLSSCVMR